MLSIALVLGGCATVSPSKTAPRLSGACPPQSVATLRANQANLGPKTDTNTLECALATLRTTTDPNDNILASRVAWQLAERSADRARRESFADEGVRLAQTALDRGTGEQGEVHYYLAVNLGLSVRDDPLRAAESLSRLEQELQVALRLSPDLDSGGPTRILGALYLKAPPWPAGIGDADRALELLKQLTERHPEHPLNHLFHAQALWTVEEEPASASVRNALKLGLQHLASGDWGYNADPWRREFAAFEAELNSAATQ